MDSDRKSRTQQKNEARALQKLGEQLVTLSSEQLQGVDIQEELLKAVMVARKTRTHEARRRQMQYIGTLMRNTDPKPIQDALENIKRGDSPKTRALKKIEKWRDEIKKGNRQIIEEILSNCPDAERQRLAQLARNARNCHETGKGEKSSRTLFPYLKEISGS